MAARPRGRGAPAVWALILLNVAMFGAEIMLGGATNTRTLHQLGALEPDSVIVGHEYWRLLTALFLHYGVLHISFNLYALYLLGPDLERMIGSFKFTISYLIAGLGSSAGVVLLSALKLTQADQLVGASGCVMGVIGVSAGLLLRHRQSPLAGRRLRNIIIIVALQTAFDLSTPQVSLSAHLSGFVTGVVVGVVLASATAPRALVAVPASSGDRPCRETERLLLLILLPDLSASLSKVARSFRHAEHSDLQRHSESPGQARAVARDGL